MNFPKNNLHGYSIETTFDLEFKKYIEIIFSRLGEDFYKKINPRIHISLNNNSVVVSPENCGALIPFQLKFVTINYNGTIAVLSADHNSYKEYKNQEDFIQELFSILINRFQAYLEYKLEKKR